MNITKEQLKKIIKEELLREGEGDPVTLPADVVFSHTKETQQIEWLLEKDPEALPEALERLKKANMKFFNAVIFTLLNTTASIIGVFLPLRVHFCL